MVLDESEVLVPMKRATRESLMRLKQEMGEPSYDALVVRLLRDFRHRRV